MSTHNICFHGKKNIMMWIPLLSGAMPSDIVIRVAII